MPIMYPQQEKGAKVRVKATSVTSNSECARCYGRNMQSKFLAITVVSVVGELSNIFTHQNCYITDNYVLGEYGTIKRVNLSQRKTTHIIMPLPPPEPESRVETEEEVNFPQHPLQW